MPIRTFSSRVVRLWFVAGIGASVLSVSWCIGQPAAFGPPRALNTDAEVDDRRDFRPHVVGDGTGNWVTVWVSETTSGGPTGTDSDILFSRSEDSGLTWSAPAPLNTDAASDSAFDESPYISTDGSGIWVAVWYRDSNGGGNNLNLFSRSADAGATWSAPAPLNTIDPSVGLITAPQLANDGAGNWVAVWHSVDDLGATIGMDADVLVSSSDDGGQTWTSAMALNTDAGTDLGSDFDPRIASDGAGAWVAVWVGDDTTEYDIKVSRSIDNGETWTAPAFLNSNAALDTEPDHAPDVATDGAGNWIAVWMSTDTLGGMIGNDWDILVSRSSDNGENWTAVAPLNTDASSDSRADQNPRIASDGAGGWVAVWNNYGNAVYYAYSDDNGATWTAPVPITASGLSGTDYAAQIANDGNGQWIIVWAELDPLNQTVGNDHDILISTSPFIAAARKWGQYD